MHAPNDRMRPMIGRQFSAARQALQAWQQWPVALFMVGFLILQGWVMAQNTPFSYPPDELAHLSYIHDSISSPVALPRYRDGTIMGSKRLNYLGHPPAYYGSLGVIGKVFHLHPKNDHLVFRLLGVAFVGIGLAFIVLAARALGLSQEATALTLVATSAVPMFSYVAGSVSNDTLLFTGMAMAFYGLARAMRTPEGPASPWALGTLTLGLVIAFLTKATGAVFLLCFGAGFALRNLGGLRPLMLWRKVWPYALVFIFLVGGYFLAIRLSFGAFLPQPAETYPSIPPASPLSFQEYVREYLSAMWRRLPVIMSHLSVDPIEKTQLPAFYAMVCLPLAGWLVTRFSGPLLTADRMAVRFFDAVAVATLGTVVVHIVFGYKGYLGNGVLSGMQPRYYMYLLPLLWFPFFSLTRAGWFKNSVTVLFATCALLTFWNSSPFLLLKQHQARLDLPVGFSMGSREGTTAAPVQLAVQAQVQGNIDNLSLTDGELRVRGWVFDVLRGEPVPRVWVLARDEFLGAFPVQARREDVAAAMGSPAALTAGFTFSARQLPASLQQCDIRLLAEYRDGTLGPIKNSHCP